MAELTDVRNRLGAAYLRGLRPMLLSLRALRTQHAQGDPLAEPGLRRLAHQLQGSGASYGHPNITDTARLVAEARTASELLTSCDALIEAVETASPSAGGVLLLVDPSPTFSAMVIRALEELTVVCASTLSQARLHIENVHPDVVLLDLALPDGDGRELLRDLQMAPGLTHMPVIVQIAPDTASALAECLAMGAEQHLTKPVSREVVAATVAGVLARRQAHAEESRVDRLTGLLNRRGIEEQFRRSESDARRGGTPLSVGILDLDGFKPINDALGHAAGDATLRHVATSLVAELRGTDSVARWGGDEFVVVMAASLSDGMRALERAAERIRSARGTHEGAELPVVAFSAGVVQLASGEGFEAAVTRADVLLAHAKRRGVHSVLGKPPPLSGPRILLVEDDPAIAIPLCLALSESGFTPDHAANAASVPDQMSYAAAILDLSLPDADGLAILAALRAHAPKLPALVLTASTDHVDLKRSFAAGADEFVQKPVSPESVVLRLQRLLARRT